MEMGAGCAGDQRTRRAQLSSLGTRYWLPLRLTRLRLRLSAPEGPLPMTKAEKKRLSTVIRATEYLFLENIALKLVLEHRAVPNWQKLLERLLSVKEMLAGVRLKFRDLYDQLEGSADPSGALEALLSELPAP